MRWHDDESLIHETRERGLEISRFGHVRQRQFCGLSHGGEEKSPRGSHVLLHTATPSHTNQPPCLQDHTHTLTGPRVSQGRQSSRMEIGCCDEATIRLFAIMEFLLPLGFIHETLLFEFDLLRQCRRDGLIAFNGLTTGDLVHHRPVRRQLGEVGVATRRQERRKRVKASVFQTVGMVLHHTIDGCVAFLQQPFECGHCLCGPVAVPLRYLDVEFGVVLLHMQLDVG
mmetsp:Transcript_32326/g.75901  ORF Transcript_32326/g.75901 Transcript_32326/m.75901 type:complete len:227 (-) Transcript_32326:567-1247(-)